MHSLRIGEIAFANIAQNIHKSDKNKNSGLSSVLNTEILSAVTVIVPS